MSANRMREWGESNHHGHRKAPTDGFEVREAHQDPSTPPIYPDRLNDLL